MTSPPEQITVWCPKCERHFRDWYRPSINLSLGEEWTEEEIEQASSVECPECHLRQDVGNLIVDQDGFWRVDGQENSLNEELE
ncbi:MAG TPA: hypothetical protein PLR25_00700 [Planctomycetaceae bacterium]|nr:hypothetical protein [Planctomycetaceae bacterium]